MRELGGPRKEPMPCMKSLYLYCRCRCRDVERQKERHGIVRMMVMCDEIVMIEHGRRRSGLSNTPLYMEHDNNRKQRNLQP